MEEFKVGEVVQLRSGGPEMTIVRESDPSGGKKSYVCTWFKNDEPKYNTFPAGTLQKVDHSGTGIFIA